MDRGALNCSPITTMRPDRRTACRRSDIASTTILFETVVNRGGRAPRAKQTPLALSMVYDRPRSAGRWRLQPACTVVSKKTVNSGFFARKRRPGSPVPTRPHLA
jgi:hypothetical protein